MFSSIPFPIFLTITLAVIIGCSFYAIKYVKKKEIPLSSILIICIISCILTLTAKCLEEWSSNIKLFEIFRIASIISGISLVLLVFLIGFYYLFKKKAKNINRPILITGMILIVLAISSLFFILNI